ncbi:MAG: hypothetical protein N4A33_01300 [Bacteriovoracaceae bacterium]|jgi:hypothetical protein|nr:hypothetical protein [Bacteriovoracaceae bacterium]
MLAFLSLIFTLCVYAQDEAYLQQIFKDKVQIIKQVTPKLEVKTRDYLLDINSDGHPEKVVLSKKDGVDFFIIKDHYNNTVLSYRLETMGENSSAFKLQLKKLNENTNVIILYFDEGYTQAEKFSKFARVYFFTIENKSIQKIYAYKGPHIFIEQESNWNSYINRRYSVTTFDYNNDGQKEISIKYLSTNRVFSYKGEGSWLRF